MKFCAVFEGVFYVNAALDHLFLLIVFVFRTIFSRCLGFRTLLFWRPVCILGFYFGTSLYS